MMIIIIMIIIITIIIIIIMIMMIIIIIIIIIIISLCTVYEYDASSANQMRSVFYEVILLGSLPTLWSILKIKIFPPNKEAREEQFGKEITWFSLF